MRVASDLRDMADDGYAGCAAAIRDMDIYWRIPELRTPTLVIAGDLDTSTPYEDHGSHIVEAIPGARAVHLPVAHLAPLEAPRDVAATILCFLEAETSQRDGDWEFVRRSNSRCGLRRRPIVQASASTRLPAAEGLPAAKRSADRTVFSSSIVTVIGPTPPGTGVK
jgi:hypothetical protein